MSLTQYSNGVVAAVPNEIGLTIQADGNGAVKFAMNRNDQSIELYLHGEQQDHVAAVLSRAIEAAKRQVGVLPVPGAPRDEIRDDRVETSVGPEADRLRRVRTPLDFTIAQCAERKRRTSLLNELERAFGLGRSAGVRL